MTSYNYEKQHWATGLSAIANRQEQVRQTLAILESPRGLEYLRFTGCRLTLEGAIEAAHDELATLLIDAAELAEIQS